MSPPALAEAGLAPADVDGLVSYTAVNQVASRTGAILTRT
jgi:hypothetical protein